MKIKYLIFLSLIINIGIYSQENNTPQNDVPNPVKPEIQVIARVQKDKILLRWAPTNAIAWKKLNTYGYIVERYTITRDNKTLETPEKIILAKVSKPEPVEKWENLIETDDNAAIVAQAIYGEEFSVTGTDNKLETIINVSEENEQRFTFALYTIDKDFEIALKAGLGFADTTAKINEKYAYRISSNVPQNEMIIEYGGIFTGLKEYQPLPKPMDFRAHFMDKSAMLSWNFKIMSHMYGSYYVERSADKKNFQRITSKPYTNLNQENPNNKQIFYIDSIANSIAYSYRIQGVTSFGELGPYSEVISGKGKSILKYVPHLTVKDFKDDSTVTLSWEFPEEGDNEISGFELNRSDKDDDHYTAVLKNIPAKNRSVTYNKLSASNYFTITAIGKQGNNRTSFPMLVQPVDSVPPSKPIGLKATIDSLGVVKISWDKNKEKDLMGYRIYKSYNTNEEASQLTVSPHEPNTYEDKVVIKNLNSKVYYKIIAVDNHYNMSPYSDLLIVKKPDLIPPTSPIFTKYDIKEGTVVLAWIGSQSEDAVSQQLYRKENEQEKWELIFNDASKAESYQDKKTIEGSTYRYAIFATDESGLKSNPSPEMALVVPKYTVKPAVKGFYAVVNTNNKSIDLSWDYKEIDVANFELYKSTNQEPMQLIQILTSESRKLSDPTLTINTTYKYGIRAVFKDGRISKMDFYTVKF